jgi:hypothetical protein
MQPQRSLIYTLAALITLPFFGTVAPATTIDIIQTFDYPKVPNVIATLPQKIEDQTDLVGTFITADGREAAFIYKPLAHSFTPPLIPPFANRGPTQGRGIQFQRHVVGEYLNQSDGTFHGYLMTHPNCTPTPTPRATLTRTPTAMLSPMEMATASDLSFVDDPEPDAVRPRCPVVYSQFDLTGALSTIPLGINNPGDICGTAIFSGGIQPAFLSVNRVITTFSVPNATATFAYQVNDSGQIVGYYVDSSGRAHGYTRDTAGALTYPIDVPGATQTFVLGNNASNWVVGRYTDTAGATHGFFYVTPNDILTYDYPGATYTTFNGINRDGLICGYYNDPAGISHGFVARVNLTGSGKPSTNTQNAPVKPAYALPQVSGIAMPAL